MNTAAATGWASKANGTHPKWWKDNGLRRCNFWIAICFLSVFSGGYDGSLLGSLQAMVRSVAPSHMPARARVFKLIARTLSSRFSLNGLRILTTLREVVSDSWLASNLSVISLEGPFLPSWLTASGGVGPLSLAP